MKKSNVLQKSYKRHARRGHALKVSNKLNTRDFSAIEDNQRAFKLIHRLAAKAGNYAAAEARALGLGTVYVQNDKLVKVFAKGDTVAITPRLIRPSFYIKYKPSTSLDVVKK